MNIKRRSNSVRRIILRTLTSSIGVKKATSPPHSINIRQILICRPNSRLGNLLLTTPMVREIENIFPKAKIDLFVRGELAPIIFKNYNNIDRIIKLPQRPFKELYSYIRVWLSIKKKQYDLVINIDGKSSSGRISTSISQSKFKIFNDIDIESIAIYPDYEHFAKLSVYNFRKQMKEYGLTVNDTPISFLDIKLTNKELAEGKALLDSLVDSTKKTLCIYTYATGSKCYTKEWWDVTYTKIKEEYDTKYNILEILPIENVSQIDFQATSYHGSDLRLIAALIANTEVFISADCGIMHLASACQIPVIGLFSQSNKDRYEPYNEKSIALKTDETDINELIKTINNILYS